MKIRLALTFPFSIGVIGGGPYAFVQTAHHLKQAGAEVTVLFLDSPGLKTFNRKSLPNSKKGEAEVAQLEAAGIEVKRVPASRLTFALDGYSMRSAVEELLGQSKMDAVISWHHEGAYIGDICRRHKLIFGFRATGNYTLISNHAKGRLWSWIIHAMIKRAITNADVVWPASNFTLREIKEGFNISPANCSLIPEGINPVFQVIKRERDPEEPVTRFLYYGSWTIMKGLFDALKAFSLVAQAGVKEWQLQIAGWGDDSRVRSAIEQYEIIDQVQFIGKLNHTALVKTLECAQVVIMPSYIESFGLAIHESQLSGLPVITYDNSSIAEIIDNGRTGWLVPNGRIDLLAEAIQEAIDNPEKTYQMGLNGRNKFANRYTWPNTAEKMLEDIRRLR